MTEGGTASRGDADGTLMIHPGYHFGAVCCGTTTITADAVAGYVWAGDAVDEVAATYGLSRLQVLTACWWRVTEAQRQRRRSAGELRIIAAWGEWADEAAMILGGHRPGPCPDPPEILP